jgi:hypothetical protein
MVNELLNVSGVRPSRKMIEGQQRHNYNNHTSLMELHGFRKFFDTTCTRDAGMNSLYTEMLMAHDTGLKGRYTKLTSEELLEGNDKNLGYASAMEHLIICEENRLKRKVELLTVRADKIEELQKTIDSVKSQLGIA